ncbi:MAG: putative metalloprotease CJM1_0395 family protein [Myxococcota bacterium]
MEINRLNALAEIVGKASPSGAGATRQNRTQGSDPRARDGRDSLQPVGAATRLTLSDEAVEAISATGSTAAEPDPNSATASTAASAGSAGSAEDGELELTPEEEEEVRKLRARDAEVRAHENAHKAAAGRHAPGAPSYDLETGPDGKQYAVGGEVTISTSPVAGDPDATIEKMQVVRRAALAPAEPSSQDRKVASQATRTEQAARVEKREIEQEERKAARADSGPLSPSASPAEPELQKNAPTLPSAYSNPNPAPLGQRINRVA